MKTSLMMVKMSDGLNVLSEITYDDNTFSYTFENPIVIQTQITPQGEVTVSYPYLPGTDLASLKIPSIFVITMAPVDDFFSKFYGSAMLKFILQREVKVATANGEESLSAAANEYLESKKNEIIYKYGIIEENTSPDNANVEIDKNRIIH